MRSVSTGNRDLRADGRDEQQCLLQPQRRIDERDMHGRRGQRRRDEA